MFCPLCNAEFRNGFDQCSDCKVALVAAPGKASGVLVWKGTSQRTMDRALQALDEAEIAKRYKEIVNTTPRLNIFGFDVFGRQPTFQYEIWVLGKDRARAQAIIAALPKSWLGMA